MSEPIFKHEPKLQYVFWWGAKVKEAFDEQIKNDLALKGITRPDNKAKKRLSTKQK